MLAFATRKALTTRGVVGSARLQVDISKAFFLEEQELENENHCCKMHCYLYENLATTIREYRTLRMCEFYRMAPILLNPQKASESLETRVQMLH